MHCLKLGYIVTDDGEGERSLHSGIIERFTTSAAGAFEPLIAGLTRPIALAVLHAYLCEVRRYSFGMV